MKFNNIKEDTKISLYITSGDKYLEIDAKILKHLSKNLAVVSLENYGNKRLTFDNVKIDVFYKSGEGVPIVFKNTSIFSHKGKYILQVINDGVKNNRRNSFRIHVGVTAWISILGKQPRQTIVKDVSLTGFAITDRQKELKLELGSRANVKFDDIGFEINLDGTVVRVEEREDCNVYGFQIGNICKDLSPYIQVKQRRK